MYQTDSTLAIISQNSFSSESSITSSTYASLSSWIPPTFSCSFSLRSVYSIVFPSYSSNHLEQPHFV